MGNYNLDFYEKAGKSVPLYLLSLLVSLKPKGLKVLDVGCFTGNFLDVAMEAGFEAYGLEMQSSAAARAARKHPGRVVHCEIECATDLSFGQFDCITAFDVIEHLRNPSALMALVGKYLKHEGLCIITTPDSYSWQARALGRYWPPYLPVEHIHLFSVSSLIITLWKSGFSVIRRGHLRKPLKLSYGIDQLRNFSPSIFPIFEKISHMVPSVVFDHQISIPLGEMWVAATIKK